MQLYTSCAKRAPSSVVSSIERALISNARFVVSEIVCVSSKVLEIEETIDEELETFRLLRYSRELRP